MNRVNNLNSSLFSSNLASTPLLRKLSLGYTSITTNYFEFQLMKDVLLFFPELSSKNNIPLWFSPWRIQPQFTS